MLRAVSAICVESQALELCTAAARRDVFKVFRTALSSSAPATAASSQTVLSGEAPPPPPPVNAASPPGPLPGPPPGPGPRRAWPFAAVAMALTSVGGVFLYRKLNDETDKQKSSSKEAAADVEAGAGAAEAGAYPASGAAFPAHVQYLVAGAGTAAFAAMRAIRAARPAAQVLLVGEEDALPYMRPPLSKELWREPELAARAAADAEQLTFRQWNGKRRNLVYEPAAFYVPVEALAASETGGAAVARGWRVTRLDVVRHEAELAAPGRAPVTLRYDKALLATGLRPRRLPALRAAAAAGRALPLRSLRDAARLAAALEQPHVRTVLVVGGGFLATELSAALAERLRGEGRHVVQLTAERAPLEGVLPPYLARDAARRLEEAGVTLAQGEVAGCAVAPGGVTVRLAAGGALQADLVVECVGAEPDDALAAASGLETHAELGGLVVNGELQARSDVYAAGDAACFYDAALGRRRVEHHDHAVLSGRLAGENMAGVAPPRAYTHQSMFWSDLGPTLGYEAIGIIDSRLPTVGIFSADAVSEASQERASAAAEEAPGATGAEPALAPTAEAGAEARRYSRGVVLYLREHRVVGVLLWNLFNRMHVARQVLAQGEFEDLFEVGKLFAPHEEE